ncbi:MAG: hypothetical protein JNK66_10285 [Chitinophagales bacterium]|nr:hypothetical protein [Chitinophagales bacterium]
MSFDKAEEDFESAEGFFEKKEGNFVKAKAVFESAEGNFDKAEGGKLNHLRLYGGCITTKCIKAIKVQGWLGGAALVLNALEPHRHIEHIGMQIDATTVFLP